MARSRRRRPSVHADPAFLAALRDIVARIAATLTSVDRMHLPVRMYMAGGAAMHYYTGARSTEDVDAVFSARVLLPRDLEVYYINARGEHRLLYFDRQYNDTLGLLHEDAHEDSVALALPGVDARVLELRALSPLDLAVSKLGRFEDHDCSDIATLARHGLLTRRAFRQRAEEALAYYVGNTERVRTSIELACRLIDTNAPAVVATRTRRGDRAR